MANITCNYYDDPWKLYLPQLKTNDVLILKGSRFYGTYDLADAYDLTDKYIIERDEDDAFRIRIKTPEDKADAYVCRFDFDFDDSSIREMVRNAWLDGYADRT